MQIWPEELPAVSLTGSCDAEAASLWTTVSSKAPSQHLSTIFYIKVTKLIKNADGNSVMTKR